MKLRVIFIAWLVICVTLLASCNRGAKQSAEVSAFNGVIKAQVENGGSLNSIISELRASAGWEESSALSLSGVYAGGGFTVTLPESPDSKLLNSYWGFPEHYNISDRDGNFFVFDKIYGFDNNGSRAATFKLITQESEYELVYVSFYYVDRDVLLDGLNLKKGWNTVSTIESLETGITYFKTDKPDLSVKWRFERAVPAAASSGPYAKILAGDLSDFAGTWKDGYGNILELRADGTVGDRGGSAYDFEKTGDDVNETYSWYLNWGGETMGYYFTLFPVGAEVVDHNSYPSQHYVTDITKVRLADTAKGVHSSNEIYYREGESPNLIDSSISSEITDTIYKRIASIENGDIAAFRSTLPPYEDGSDYNYQLQTLNTFFGDIFGIDPVTFSTALSEGTEELAYFADKLFFGTHPPKNRNTGLHIIKIESIPADFGFRVTSRNNNDEEIVYIFPYSSF